MDEALKLTSEERELVLERRKSLESDAEIKKRFDQVIAKKTGAWSADDIKFVRECFKESLGESR